ncbi:GNAT family N-acetyltransferase [Paraglaciecola marina]|uniref:GNAT family N-acetyltransferase n=1 Tax=Paraglaciecola marina TaxID=2500157 RepID=UPI00105EF681|nr:GNAT family N-acetyltransferase [Paraglaciecola marina]
MKRKTFKELDIDDLYAICKLRQDVFIIEQNSIYADLDGLDQISIHYLDTNQDDELKGYARYRETEEGHFKIERVVLKREARGTGVGKSILNAILKDIKRISNDAKVSLSAQTNALRFYHLLGFQEVGEAYDDGGIEHMTMILK